MEIPFDYLTTLTLGQSTVRHGQNLLIMVRIHLRLQELLHNLLRSLLSQEHLLPEEKPFQERFQTSNLGNIGKPMGSSMKTKRSMDCLFLESFEVPVGANWKILKAVILSQSLLANYYIKAVKISGWENLLQEEKSTWLLWGRLARWSLSMKFLLKSGAEA